MFKMKSLYAECIKIKNPVNNTTRLLCSRKPFSVQPMLRPTSTVFLASLLTGTMLLAAIMALTSPAQATTIYSWVDENSVQHFSAMPPTNRDDFDVVTIVGNKTLLTRAESRAIAAQPRVVENSNTAAADEVSVITAPDTTVTVIDPEIVARNCERARQNMFLIDSRRRIVITGDDGEQRRLNDDERAALMQKSQDYIDEKCQS
jgi:hypothetical protein